MEAISLTKRRRRKTNWIIFVLPAFLFLWIACFSPIGVAFKMSFFRPMGNKEVFVGLLHYARTLQDSLFWQATKNTFYITGITVFSHLLLGLTFALLLNKPIKFQKLWRGLHFVPWIFPPVVVAVIWILMYQSEFGFINTVLSQLGLSRFRYSWLGRPNTALTMVAIACIWCGFPLYSIMLLAARQNIPPELYDAAAVDGGSERQQFSHITIPLLMPTILTILLLDTIWTFRFFDLVWVMTKGGPVHTSEILPTYVYKTAFLEFDFNRAASIAGLMFLFMLCFCIIYIFLYRPRS